LFILHLHELEDNKYINTGQQKCHLLD